MPITPTYPGVYIEEIPSGVRTITGVATSITAFIGRARQGPVNDATIVNSYADFERTFGFLWIDSTMSYAVRDFFLNGGSQAVIVRVTAAGASAATIALATEGSPSEDLELEAANVGAWGNNLSAAIDHDTDDLTNPISPPDPNLFNLTIFNDGVEVEKHLNLTMDSKETRFVTRVLEQAQSVVRVKTGSQPAARPVATASPTPSASGGNDGDAPDATDYIGAKSAKTGIYALENTDLFNLLCIPPPTRAGDTDNSVYQDALAYCVKRRAMLIVDPPFAWGDSVANATNAVTTGLSDLGLFGTDARNAAIYFPRVRQSDPEREGQVDTFVPCGIIAGIMSRTDSQRGVWKAPAGLDAAINGIQGLQLSLTDNENGQLNPIAVNCLRSFRIHGRVVWGARTLRGADQAADEYKYVPVRRLALFIEETLFRGTQWVVFEPNDEPLWAQIRLNLGAFMHTLFRQGAFQGSKPKDAYLVKCDRETTTQSDIDRGIVNILVGFAPLKPAEFVIIKIQQLAGQIEA